MQKELTEANQAAWDQSPYEAWMRRFGTPAEAAAKIKENPAARLASLYEHIGDPRGKKIINLLGSHGGKAVALALLGADATVADFSTGNARYAKELAEAAGVQLRYIVSDVLQLPEEERSGDYDIVLMEFGILHYFTDLKPLFAVVFELLGTGGRLLLQDFHPFTTKLISSKGTRHTTRKHKIDGDYFDTSVEEVEIPYLKFLPEAEREGLAKTRLRRWNLGEIVTAVADSGLTVKLLKEEPNLSSDVYDKGIPKSFILAAQKN
jgi:ubiquinone/menaquinone biosynthesis C-methylase UbiE